MADEPEQWKNLWVYPRAGWSASCNKRFEANVRYFGCQRYPSKECAEQCAELEMKKYPDGVYLGAFPA